MTPLAEAVAGVVDRLGAAHIERLAAAYAVTDHWSEAAAAGVRVAVPAPHRSRIEALNESWRRDGSATGGGLALALRTALAARRRSDLARVEVVVTGPDSPAAPVRLTSQVVRELIDTATSRVTLVSFAAYRIPVVVAALERAERRGVQVSLILESPAQLIGGGGADAYARFRTYCWPADHRDPPDAKLHAKAVIVDGRDALLTSANMTNAAYRSNIELGVLCRGGEVARQVQHHFDALIASGVLEPVTSS